MNCERFEILANYLAREEMFEASERAAALAHVSECDRCARGFEEQLRLSHGLRALAADMSPQAAPSRTEQQVLAAFRQGNDVQTFTPRKRSWTYWATAAAAALLLAFAFAAWRYQHRALPVPNQPEVAGNSTPAPIPSASESPRQTTEDLVVSTPPHKSSPRPRIRATRVKHDRPQPAIPPIDTNAANAEVVTDFLQVGYGNAQDLQDGGQLVRVELPRLALARFGLPVNMELANERVKADVLLGPDGMARAIRFVR